MDGSLLGIANGREVLAESRTPAARVLCEALEFTTEEALQFVDITAGVSAIVARSDVWFGQVTVYSTHTTAAIKINENEPLLLEDLKQTLHMDVLRTKSVDGIHKELTVFAIVYNLVRLVMLEAAQRQGVMPDRISFVDALRWLVAAGTGLPLRRIRVLPLRPDRHEPRVRKRRPKNYPLMTKPHAELTQALSGQRLKP